MERTAGSEAPPQRDIREPRATSGKAIASLVLGIIGLTGIPFVASLIALVLGYSARTEIRAEHQKGGELATAGIVLGWVGVGLTAAALLVAAVFFVSL